MLGKFPTINGEINKLHVVNKGIKLVSFTTRKGRLLTSSLAFPLNRVDVFDDAPLIIGHPPLRVWKIFPKFSFLVDIIRGIDIHKINRKSLPRCINPHIPFSLKTKNKVKQTCFPHSLKTAKFALRRFWRPFNFRTSPQRPNALILHLLDLSLLNQAHFERTLRNQILQFPFLGQEIIPTDVEGEDIHEAPNSATSFLLLASQSLNSKILISSTCAELSFTPLTPNLTAWIQIFFEISRLA